MRSSEVLYVRDSSHKSSTKIEKKVENNFKLPWNPCSVPWIFLERGTKMGYIYHHLAGYGRSGLNIDLIISGK
jgi:hypothetical protein